MYILYSLLPHKRYKRNFIYRKTVLEESGAYIHDEEVEIEIFNHFPIEKEEDKIITLSLLELNVVLTFQDNNERIIILRFLENLEKATK